MKTDSQIQIDVIAELKFEPTVNPTHIGVTVKDGIVSLLGTVENYFEKYHAEKATQRVSGVRGVAMAIDVKLPSVVNRTDAEIAHAIDNVITWSSLLNKDEIHVKVESGWVTLTGTVKWNYQKTMLNSSVGHLMGVTGISDQITISNDLNKTVVKKEILDSLNRRAKTDANNITVDVKGGEVTLSGKIHDFNERELVKHAAWSSAGVVKVTDKLTLGN
jgi:osmotically-inducible protein OsmY